jgi:hypothetical protein
VAGVKRPPGNVAGWEDFTLAWKRCGPWPAAPRTELALGGRLRLLTGKVPFPIRRL